MADGVNITQGTGTTIATDDIGGVQYQRVKLSQGADGSATDVSSAAPLNVTLANTGANATALKVDGSAVTQPVSLSGTVAVTQSGTWDEVGINDSGNSITVDNSTLAVVGGGTEATAMRVTIASDSTGVVSVDDNGGSITVDGTVAVSGTVTVGSHAVTNAGTFAVQNTAATPAGTNNIGDVDVLTINGVAPAFGTGVRGATVQRVTIATDDSVPVTGTFYQATQPVSAASLPLPSGAATSALQTTQDTSINTLLKPANTLAGVTTVTTVSTLTNQSQMGGQAIAMGTGTRSAGTQRVTVATDDLVPVSMATNTPVGNVAHDAVDSGAPIKIGGRARTTEITAVASDDRVDSIHDKVGKQVVLPYSIPESFVSGAITTAMTATTSTSLVAAPAAGLRNYLTTIIVSNAHATVGTDVIIQDGSGGTTLMTIPAAAVYGGAVITLPTPLRQPTTATAIFCANVTTGASTKVSAVGYTGA